LLKGLVEGVALTAVEGEHGRILRDATERLRHHALRDAGGDGFRGNVLHEGVKIAAAAGGESGGGGKRRGQHNGQMNFSHEEAPAAARL
jgi:hypothetical protein